MEETVKKKFGSEKWSQSLKNAGFSASRTFSIMEDVLDSDVTAIFEGIARTTSLSVEQIKEAFGEHWSTIYAPIVYKAYYTHVKNARELLLNLDHIHDVTTKTMKSARPPSFRYEWRGDDLLIMHYSSQRGMITLMPGLIRGVGKYFNEKLVVSVVGTAIEIQFPKGSPLH
jgi:methyl-accepting chemotaxis protein